MLSNAASIQQAIDGSNTTAPVTIQVGAGQYAENLTISHALTLSGNDGTMAAGADPSAPLLVGIQAGGGVITVTANNVTIDGLHLNGSVDAGAEPSSLDGIVASGVDGLTVSHNTLDGFSGAAIDTPGSADVTLNANGIIPTLLSTAVSPANPTVVVGADEQLTDTGTYSEGPTADLTTTATWTSSDPAVATVDAAGVANAVGPGTSTISASVGDLSCRPRTRRHWAAVGVDQLAGRRSDLQPGPGRSRRASRARSRRAVRGSSRASTPTAPRAAAARWTPRPPGRSATR